MTLKTIFLSVLITSIVGLTIAHLDTAFEQGESPELWKVSQAELDGAFGRDAEGMCCSIGTGGMCADPSDWPWTSGCECSGVHCCSCTNPGDACFARVSEIATNDECLLVYYDPLTEPKPVCEEVEIVPCFEYKDGVCHGDAGGYNPFAFCMMCGCSLVGAELKLYGTRTACKAGTTGC